MEGIESDSYWRRIDEGWKGYDGGWESFLTKVKWCCKSSAVVMKFDDGQKSFPAMVKWCCKSYAVVVGAINVRMRIFICLNFIYIFSLVLLSNYLFFHIVFSMCFVSNMQVISLSVLLF